MLIKEFIRTYLLDLAARNPDCLARDGVSFIRKTTIFNLVFGSLFQKKMEIAS